MLALTAKTSGDDMNSPPKDVDQILPYGEMLRGFLEQPFVSKADLKELLRRRGVFICGSEKNHTIPILMTTLLSPDEFDWLLECQQTREDNIKIITQTIPWSSDKSIIETLPDNFQLSAICEDTFANYNVVGSPNFTVIDGNHNHLKIEFDVERTDMTKNWSTTKNKFAGFVELEQDVKSKKLKIVIGHTASETKSVGSKATTALINHFKTAGVVKSTDQVKKILFSSFSNDNRIKFLMDITQDSASQSLAFEDILDIEVSPDQHAILPEGIKWMQERIEDLRINGKAIHKTFFVQEHQYHKYLHLHNIEAQYQFSFGVYKGICIVGLGFPEYSKGKNLDSELEINVKSITIMNHTKGLIKSDIKKEILKEIETIKMLVVDNYL